MSTADIARAPGADPASGALSRGWRIVRLLTANPATTIGWPLFVLSAIFVMNWAIWWILFRTIDPAERGDPSDGITFNGAMSFIFIYMLIVAVQSVNLTFPLALGYGATRRSFSAGSALTFVLLSVGYATLLAVGAWLEEATGGWGLGGAFFRTFYFTTDAGGLAQWWIYFCWLVFFLFTGTFFAAMYVRWRATGLIVSFGLLGVLVIGLIALLTLTASWLAFWETLATLGTLGVANVALVPAVLAAVVGYLVLSRATPRG